MVVGGGNCTWLQEEEGEAPSKQMEVAQCGGSAAISLSGVRPALKAPGGITTNVILAPVSYNLAAVNYNLAAVRYNLAAVSYNLAAVSYNLAAISYN